MPKRSSKKSPADINVLASSIVQAATGQELVDKITLHEAAVALGRLGGLKGGKARAEKLPPKRRRQIAQTAAKIRWTAKAREK